MNASPIHRIWRRLRRLAGRSQPAPFPPDLALLLDPEWYVGHYQDVADGGMDPLQHFLAHGVQERRDPNALFDTQWYLSAYPDVARAGVPPVLHYVVSGAAELRDPGPLFSTREHLESYPWLLRVGLNPLAHRILSDFVAPPANLPLPWAAAPDYGDSPVPTSAVDVVAETIRAFEATEPDLAALKDGRLQDFPVISQLSPRCEQAWAELYRTLTRPPRRVIFVPALSQPDPAVLHLVRAVEDAGALGDTLVLSTDETARPAPTWLPRQAQWRAYSDLGMPLGPEERTFLTTTFLHSLRPSAALLAGSRAAWDALLAQGSGLAGLTRLYGWAPSGLRPEPSTREDLRAHFRTCLPYLRGLYLEDERLGERLVQRYGLPEDERSKLVVLRRPFRPEGQKAAAVAGKRPRSSQGRILWVGDPDDRAEASLRSAFGRFVPDVGLELWRSYLPAVPALDADADTIADFDCVLLTAAPEGAADVVLDAAACQVPLIHPGPGPFGLGAPSRAFDADALFAREALADPVAELSARVVWQVRRLLADEAERKARLEDLMAYAAARHAPEAFLAALTAEGGFLAPLDAPSSEAP